MKKNFTLLAFLVVTANAAAQYYGYLNVGDPDEIHKSSAGDGYSNSTSYAVFSTNADSQGERGVVESGRLNVSGYAIYYGSFSDHFKWWIDDANTTVGRTYLSSKDTPINNWGQVRVFKGLEFFLGTNYKYVANSGKATFYITNCIGIDILLYHNTTNSGTFTVTATPKDENSDTFSGTSVSSSETLSAKSTYFPSLNGLDKTKIYKIELIIPANTYFYEISFVINNFEPTVTGIDGNNWGTIYLDYPVRIPTNEHSTLHAYTIEGIGDDNKVTLGEVSNYIPANTGVLLWEEEPNDKPIIFTETGKNIAEISENWLKGTTADNFTVGDALDGKPSTAKVLTLGRSGGKLGFFIYNGSLGKNKAYLLYDYGADSPINVKGFYISGFDDMTDIQTVESESTETGNWYSLQGVRLNARPMQRGIYLNNGKKVFVK
jgi:hypothetical protein